MLNNICTHQKSILLVEDLETYSTPVTRWLKRENYAVRLAKTFDEAIQLLDREHFHVAVVDIRLVDEDQENCQGLDFLEAIVQRRISDILPVIILTGYPSNRNILQAYRRYKIFDFITKEPGYRQELLESLRRAFFEKIRVNFELDYALCSDELLKEIALDIQWSGRKQPSIEILTAETQDLFGALFQEARTVYLSKLAAGLSGAAVTRVKPIWAENHPGPERVVKIDRIEKAEKEFEHYIKYVKNLMPHTSTQVNVARSQHLGGLLYYFAEEDSVPFEEFDDFYRRERPEVISGALHDLIFNSCRYWYDHSNPQFRNLPDLYFDAFKLERESLVAIIRDIVPDYAQEAREISLPDTSQKLPNPLYLLYNHYRLFDLLVRVSITHGDLTGRNIMVDRKNKCWLIDFYRTYPSHILRDFVILETDLKFRLAHDVGLEEFLRVEHTLMTARLEARRSTAFLDWSEDSRKMFRVVTALRNIADHTAFGIANSSQNWREYLISLLMATLNVMRLRHIDFPRKLHALYSASLLSEELEKIENQRQ